MSIIKLTSHTLLHVMFVIFQVAVFQEAPHQNSICISVSSILTTHSPVAVAATLLFSFGTCVKMYISSVSHHHPIIKSSGVCLMSKMDPIIVEANTIPGGIIDTYFIL